MKKLLAFHNKQSIKDKYIKRVEAHVKADEIIKGRYWKNGKGCAVGCTIHGSSHDKYPKELGISWRIALVEDSLFERMPNEMAKKFPLEFLNAVQVGSDTELVFKKFIMWILGDRKTGLMYIVKDEKQKSFLKRVYDLYKKSLKEEINQSEWKKLADEAYSTYASTYTSASTSAYTYTSAYASTYAYAYAYVYNSASASAYTSAYAYAYAYNSIYASKEWQEKFDEYILLMKNKLIKLLKSAK